MIKGMLTGAMAVSLLLSVEPANTFAARPVQMQNFVCNSSNRICDYTQKSCVYTDADGGNTYDNSNTQAGNGTGGAGYGGNFVDADGDGICDNNTAFGQPQGCAGQGYCGNGGNGGNGGYGGNGYRGGRGR